MSPPPCIIILSNLSTENGLITYQTPTSLVLTFNENQVLPRRMQDNILFPELPRDKCRVCVPHTHIVLVFSCLLSTDFHSEKMKSPGDGGW